MNAIRVRKRVDSEMAHVLELKGMVGKTVEIIILEETPAPGQPPETPGSFTALVPKAAFDPNALEAMRGQLTKQQFKALSPPLPVRICLTWRPSPSYEPRA